MKVDHGKNQGFLAEAIYTTIDKSLFTITTQKQKAVVTLFLNWFTQDAQLKPVPDLQQRLVKMGPKLTKMAENLQVTIKDGKLVVKSDAESEVLLSLLRRGSDWFEPHPDVNAAILLGLLNGGHAT